MGYPPESILVHGNYLINLGNPDPLVVGSEEKLTNSTKWEQAYECFRDDVNRCYQLGIKLYNWQ